MWLAASLLHVSCMVFLASANQTEQQNDNADLIAQYAQRMQEATPKATVTTEPQPTKKEADPETGASKRATEMIEHTPTSLIPLESLERHVPDPEQALKDTQAALEKAEKRIDKERLAAELKYIGVINRPKKLRLSLEDALRRTLENNFAIRVSSYNPAIEATRVVEAEAAFDAAFFTTISNNKVDRPSGSPFVSTKTQAFNSRSGIRKLLATGMQVETAYSIQRSSTNFQYQTVNPEWFDQFAVTFRQPLLRGFGIDVNRSQVRLQKLSQRQATQSFRRDIRETLRSAEVAYWRLVHARRNLVISAKLLGSFEQIFTFLDERKDFDVYRIQLADVRARLEASKVDFVELVANVRIAEDQLIALMNDPEVDLADDIQIIPTDLPLHQPVELDEVAEVQTALDNRSEVVEAKIGIDVARIQVGVSKNQALPQLDVSFSYTVDGLGGSHEDAFDQVTKNDYHEYGVGVEFELPVGNRARRAALQRSKLQYAQAIAALKQALEQVILDTNTALRQVKTALWQIEPSLNSANATEDQVNSIIARAERKDYLTLNNELSTRQALAQARSSLLSSLIDYGIAVVDLERSKGTLLKYNNIDMAFDDSDDPAN